MRDDAASRSAVRSTDFDEVVSTMRATFGGVDLARDGHAQPQLSLRAAHLPDLTTARWSLRGVNAGSRGDETPEPAYLTGLVLGGRVRMWTRWDDVDVDRPFLYPEPVDAELHEPDVANLGLSRSVVQTHADAITGIDDFDLRFSGTAPIDTTMDRVWRDTMAYTARTADALVEEADGIIAHAQLLDLLSTLMLRTFPNSTLDAENQRDVIGPRGAPLRRALRYMEDHLAEPITIVEIAEAARLSPRGLHAAFQRDLHVTPMAYLRGLRLSAVRDELREADPDHTTVATVALHWGFVDTARFAARYAARFGQSPDETLRR